MKNFSDILTLQLLIVLVPVPLIILITEIYFWIQFKKENYSLPEEYKPGGAVWRIYEKRRKEALEFIKRRLPIEDKDEEWVNVKLIGHKRKQLQVKKNIKP